ncbi:armadillo repeat-containing protein 8 [Dorcoceras hygrometricum]|uniref:Armadillo repeat-containing protein 8 n=1 Tax=Dorcoceras hygrometricum TaxID=472368 RepID=A0A2Z7BKU1_9LAMI|nr:armadillo repeat-containing protein 8 [Dorcoceras hygrometricum]
MKKNSNQATGIPDDLSSKMECCRDKVLPLKVFDFAIDALAHDSAEVHTAACIFLKNIFCSVKNLSAEICVAGVDVLLKRMKKNSNQATGIPDDLSSKLECCRDKVLPLKVFDFAIDALAHDSAEVHTTTCIFLKNIFCSVKILSAGHFMSETVVLPLVQILCNSCMSVQISVLRAISNVAVVYTM